VVNNVAMGSGPTLAGTTRKAPDDRSPQSSRDLGKRGLVVETRRNI